MRHVLWAAGLACLGAPVLAVPQVPAPAEAASAPDALTGLLLDKGLIAVPSGAPAALAGRLRDGASEMVLTALNLLGVPYQRGGKSAERGFDCSGFTRHVFELSLGRLLPRRADEQAQSAGLASVRRDELKPGDLVFFNTLRRTFSHVGIYIGEGKFIHSPSAGGEVRIEDLRAGYWMRRYTGARRAELDGMGPAPADQAAASNRTVN